MSVARLNKTRLNLNPPGKKKISRNVNKKHKRDIRPASEIMLTVIRKACISGVCLLVLVVAGLGCFAGYRWLTAHPYFALKDIKITGNQRLSYGELLGVAGVGLNKNSLAINIGDVEARLSKNSWIQSAMVRRQLPGKLQIHITEKDPQFMVRQDNKLYYCDNAGELIAPVVPGKFTSLPYLNIAADAMDKVTILPQLMGILNRRELPFDSGQIAWINIKGGNRMEIFMDNPGLTIQLGLDDWKEQLSHLTTVWNDLKHRGEFRNVTAISTDKGRVWVKKKLL